MMPNPEILALQDKFRGAAVPVREAIGSEDQAAGKIEVSRDILNTVLAAIPDIQGGIRQLMDVVNQQRNSLTQCPNELASSKAAMAEAEMHASTAHTTINEAGAGLNGTNVIMSGIAQFHEKTTRIPEQVGVTEQTLSPINEKLQKVYSDLEALGQGLEEIGTDIRTSQTSHSETVQIVDESRAAGNGLALQLEGFQIQGFAG